MPVMKYTKIWILFVLFPLFNTYKISMEIFMISSDSADKDKIKCNAKDQ